MAYGLDLGSVLRGKPIPDRPLHWYMPLYDLRWAATPCAVVREGDWKLIEYFGEWFNAKNVPHDGAHLELFNLRTDLGETTNRVEREPERTRRMRDQLHAWLKSVPAEIPGKSPHFDPARRFEETKQKQPWVS
jgi:arylsulfatase A